MEVWMGHFLWFLWKQTTVKSEFLFETTVFFVILHLYGMNYVSRKFFKRNYITIFYTPLQISFYISFSSLQSNLHFWK